MNSQSNLNTIRYLILTTTDLKDIDYRKKFKEDLAPKQIQIPKESTMDDLYNEIQQKQKLSNSSRLRAWKNSKSMTQEKLHREIVQKCRPIHYDYKIPGMGKLLENEQAKIQEVQIEEGDYFIIEHTSGEKAEWFLISPDEKKCEGCYKYKKLPFQCGCKKVAYCTKSCLQRDKIYHTRNCTYAQEEELNKKIQMTMTGESRKGLVGLNNLGNTCFMNSCLQCLSHTLPLTQYFLGNHYESEINKDNPIGTRGKLAKSYARFIQNMWCESERTFNPSLLKSAVSSVNQIFSGYAQHDSQEFFSFLADGIHEDLNRIKKKPYVETVQSKGRKDDIVAMESWLGYTKRNQSIIVDIMTGQYKSTVTCPDCNLESVTFDPFTTVSLPIPEETSIGVLKYYILFSDYEEPTKKMCFEYKKPEPKGWAEKAAGLIKMPAEQFRMYILTQHEDIYDCAESAKSEVMSKIEAQSKYVFLIQLNKEEMEIKDKLALPVRMSKKGFYADDFQTIWFKRPYFFSKKKLRGIDIVQRILKYLYNDTYDDSQKRSKIFSGKSYEDYMKFMLKNRPFKLYFKWKKSFEAHYHRKQVKFDAEEEIYDDADVIEMLSKHSLEDIEIDAKFNKDGLRQFSFERLKKFDDCTERFQKKQTQKMTVTIDQCFEVMQRPQELEKGNEWYCPRCKDHKLATKEMVIYKAPEILILHLKRFKSKGIIRKEKNETNVIFPQSIDMTKYVIDPTPMSTYISKSKKEEVYIEPSYKQQLNAKSEPIYDLYAISNHYGGLGGGHYTAYGKNDGSWYEFNDSSVHRVSGSELKGSGAYLLFFQRRN